MNRKKRIIEADFHEQYKLFLFECEEEPLPEGKEWENHLPYTIWVKEMNIRFKQENNIPLKDSIIWYLEERELWVSEQLAKYIQ